MPRRKGFRIYFNDNEDQSNYVGSIRDCIDSYNTSYERKIKESSKKNSVSIKNVKISDATRLPQETSKHLNSSAPHTLSELPLSNKESSKNRYNLTMKPPVSARSKKKILTSKRSFLSYHKSDTQSLELKSKTPLLKSRLKSNKQIVAARCVSLTDIRDKDELVLTSPPPGDIFSLTPSRSEDFAEKGTNSNDKSDYYDYAKTFDFIRDSILLKQWEKSLLPSQKEWMPVSKFSSNYKSFRLKRKTYSCGILSINDPEVSSKERDTSDAKESSADTLKCDPDESDVCYLTENSESYDCDSISESEVSENKNILDTSTSSLNIKHPLRVKYVDETTMQDKELLIYSKDFLDNLSKERGKSESNIEVFENILKQSTVYEGNKLRVIPDIKEFFRNLKINNKHQKGSKCAQVSKHDAEETSKKKVIQSQRKVQNTPCRRESLFNSEVANKRKDNVLPVDNYVKLRSQKVCEKRNGNGRDNSNSQIREAKKCFPPRDILNSRNKSKELEDINIKIGDHLSETGPCSKSRTALKRINTEEIIASNFRNYFQFYAKFGGRLKSGVVISKMNSHFWLKKSGIIYDSKSFTIADDCFDAVAKRKLVLGISDYMLYLAAVARRQRLFFMDVIKQLMMDNDLQRKIKQAHDLESNASQPQLISKSQKSTQSGKNNNFVNPPQKKNVNK